MTIRFIPNSKLLRRKKRSAVLEKIGHALIESCALRKERKGKKKRARERE